MRIIRILPYKNTCYTYGRTMTGRTFGLKEPVMIIPQVLFRNTTPV